MFPIVQSINIPARRRWIVSVFCVAAFAISTPLRASAPPSDSKGMAERTRRAETGSLERRHLDTLAVAATARSDETLCAALVSADQTQQSLGSDLQRRRDMIFEQSPSDSAALKRLEQRAAAAVDRLPGVGLAIGAETVYHYVRYGALASYAPSGSASARALGLAGDIWTDPAGLAVYYEPSTDISGCQRPSSVVPILRDLAAAWPSVASCLKSSLLPKLMASGDELMNGTCYCGDEPETASALKEVASLMKVFAGSSGVSAGSSSFAPPAPAARKYICR